jgi:site-specific DNA recombinase
MTKRAGIYVRISSDPEGKRLGVTRQLEDCEKKAAAMGWEVGAVFEDNDKSASNGRRPKYERMLADLEAKKIDAVIVWDLDRLTRRPIELEHFMDLADRRSIALASVGGDVDLATDNGRLFARIKGAVSRAEIERKSARQTRANLQRAEAGAPDSSGRRCFGYSPDGTEIVEHEAAEIRKAADAIVAGATVRGIARDLNDRGVMTSTGAIWRNTELRRMLKNPRYAALRVYQGQVIGAGSWPPIIDEDTHYAVLAVLAQPERHKAGPPRRYLLSGLAHCGVCDARLFGVTEKVRGTLYRCSTRKHVGRRAEEIDNFVESVIIARLSRTDAAELFAREDKSDQVAALRKDETGIRSRLDGLAEAFASGEIDRMQLRKGTERLRAKLEQVTDDLAATVSAPAVAELVAVGDVEAAWGALDLDRKRAVIDTLMAIKVHPVGRGGRRFNPSTVEIRWKS